MWMSVALAAGRLAVIEMESPQQVLWQADTLVVVDGAGEAIVLDAGTLKEQRRIAVGRWPQPASLSQDGTRLLVPARKSAVFDVHTGERLYKTKSRWGPPAMALSDDGQSLLVAGDTLDRVDLDTGDGQVLSWDSWSVSHLGEMDGATWSVQYGTVEHDGQTHVVSESVWRVDELDGALALVSWGHAQVVDLESGVVEWVAPPTAGNAGELTFSPDGRWVAWTGTDATVHTWDRRDHVPGPTLGSGAASNGGITFSPDSRQLAIMRWDGVLEVHAMEGGPGTRARPLFAGFTQDLAVAVFDNGAVLVWEEGAAGYRLRGKYLLPLDSAWEPDRTVAVTPDGMLVGATSQGTVETWDLRTGAPVMASLPATPGDTHIAVGDDGSLAVRSGAWVTTYNPQRRGVSRMPSSNVSRMAVGRGGTRLAVLGSGGIVVYDTLTGRSVATHAEEGLHGAALAFDGRDVLFTRQATLMRWNLVDEPTVVIHSDEYPTAVDLVGQRLLVATTGMLEADEVSAGLPDVEGYVDIGLHPERPVALRADQSGRVEVLDLVSGEATRLRGQPSGTRAAAAWDGRWAVIQDGHVVLDDGQVLPVESQATALALTPDGPIVGTAEGTLGRWTDGQLVEVSVAESPIQRLVWRGGTLVALDGGGTVSAYDPMLQPRPLPYTWATGMDVTPQGDPVYGAGWDGVKVFRQGEWQPLKARRRHLRSMSGHVAVCADGTVVAAAEDWRRPDRLYAGSSRLKPLDGGVPGVTGMTCDQRVALGTWSGMVAVVNPHTGDRGTLLAGDGSAVVGLAWVDADTLVVSWASGEVAVVDVD